MCGCGKLTVRKNKNQQKLRLALIQKRKSLLLKKKSLQLKNDNNIDSNNLEFKPAPGLIGQTTAQVRGNGGVGVRRLRRGGRKGQNKRRVGMKKLNRKI